MSEQPHPPEVPPPRFPTHLFWLSAVALFAAGIVHAALASSVLLLVMWSGVGTLWVFLVLALGLFVPVAGGAAGFAVSRIPRPGIQVALFLFLAFYAVAAFVAWFLLRSVREPSWPSLMVLLALIAATTMIAALVPWWFARRTRDSGRLTYLLLAVGFLGQACFGVFSLLRGIGFRDPVFSRPIIAQAVMLLALASSALVGVSYWRRARTDDARDEGRAPTFAHYAIWTALAFAAMGLGDVVFSALGGPMAVGPDDVPLLFLHLAATFAFAWQGPGPVDARARVHIIIVAIAAFFVLLSPFVMTLMLGLRDDLAGLYLLIPCGFFGFSRMPARTALISLCVLALPAVGGLFLLRNPASPAAATFYLGVFWLGCRTCLGRVAGSAPDPAHLPQFMVCLLLGFGLARLQMVLLVLFPWSRQPIAQFAFFLALACVLPLIPLRGGQSRASREHSHG